MQYNNILFYLFLFFGTISEVYSFTFYINKNNYQYYYYQLNSVERNIYNEIINNLDNIILENDYIYLNTTDLIRSFKGKHASESSTIQNSYLIFSNQLNKFRNYFNNAKISLRSDYPELSFIDWDDLDIEYTKNGKLILVHNEKVIVEKLIEDPNTNNTITTTDNQYEKSYKYLYKGLTENLNSKEDNLKEIDDLLIKQVEFIYYKIIKNAFIDIPIIVNPEFSWSVSSLRDGINTVISNVIDNIYENVKEFDIDNITYGKNNITDSQYIDRNANEVYSLFKSGYATSANLAKIFKLAMDYIGIDCVLIWGKTTDNVKKNNTNSLEIWNSIKLFNEWYSIDVAFNYYNICMFDEVTKTREIKLNSFVDCATEKWNEKNKSNNDANIFIPYTFFGSVYTSYYLEEDSFMINLEDTYVLFPKLSQQNYELIMDLKLNNQNYNITTLIINKVSANKANKISETANDIDMKESILKLTTEKTKKKRENNQSSLFKQYDLFVKINVKSIDFQLNDNELLENTILSYDIFSETFDVNSMSYLLVKEIQETKYVKIYNNDKKSNKRFNNEDINIEMEYSIKNISSNKNGTFFNNNNNNNNNSNNKFASSNFSNIDNMVEKEKKENMYINLQNITSTNDYNMDQNINDLNESLDNDIYSEDYTYVLLTKNYTTYQFITGHTFTNINNDRVSSQYLTIYIVTVPISKFNSMYGENFSIGKEGYEEVVEDGEVVMKKYNDWSNFYNKYKNTFEILYQSKYMFFDTSPPLIRHVVTINYKESSPLPNYYIDLKSTNITVCYNQPLILKDELSIDINYSLTKPILDKNKNKLLYSTRYLQYNSETNCINFEFSPDISISNVIYYFHIKGLTTQNNLKPASFSYTIFPMDDYESQRNILYQDDLNDETPSSKIVYSIPNDDIDIIMFYDEHNNVYYKNDILLSSSAVKEGIKENMKDILIKNDNYYNDTEINTEILTKIDIRATTGVSLVSTTPLEILIPWSNQFKRYNYNTYKCYMFDINEENNSNGVSKCSLKFYSHGVIINITSSQYLWIISYQEEETNKDFQNKYYRINYNINQNLLNGEFKQNEDSSSKNEQDLIQVSNISNENNSNVNINHEKDKIYHNYEKNICKSLDIIYQKKLDKMNYRVENVIIDQIYNCYFDIRTKFKYYCYNTNTGDVITTKNGKCKIKKGKAKHKIYKKNNFFYNENSNYARNTKEVNNTKVFIPQYGLESTLLYFSVILPLDYGVKEISIINKETEEVMYTSSENKDEIECISKNRSYRIKMPSNDIEISIEYASNNLRVEYIIVDNYQINIQEGQYFYYAVVKDKNDITQKPIIIKTENPYVTYNISYFILNEEIYIIFISPNNEYSSYTIRYVSKNNFSYQSSVSMFYINKEPIISYPYNSNIFIYCNSDPYLSTTDIIENISIKESNTVSLSFSEQGDKISVKVTSESMNNYNMYNIVPLDENDDVFNLYCVSSISDNDLNSNDDNKSNNSNNNNDNNNKSFSSLKCNYSNLKNTIIVLIITYIYLFI